MNGGPALLITPKYQLDELPYRHSPKLEWIGQTSVSPAAGSFTFPGTSAIAFTPAIPLKPRALYFLEEMDFDVNANELDFQGAVTTNFKLTLEESAGGNPVLRYPLEFPSFVEGAPIKQYFYPQAEPNNLNFRLAGVAEQTMALAGLTSMKATIIIRAYEITQPKAIEAILRGYDDIPPPPPPRQPGPKGKPGPAVAPKTSLMPGFKFGG